MEDRALRHPIFVVQQHAARRLHYDFRLEVDGALESWAVPKGPSCDPRRKRLAILTEPHDLDYARFEGVIPPDHYGAGTVLVWDLGTYRNLRHDAQGRPIPMRRALADGLVEVELFGRKLRGGWALVRTRLSDRSWLLVKRKDEFADPHRDLPAERPESVLSGRTLEEIALGAGDE